MSWIDPYMSLAKLYLLEYDRGGDPGQLVSRANARGGTKYRFANFLEVWVEIANGQIRDFGFTKDSDMYCSPSYLGIPSMHYRIPPTKTRLGSNVRFVQLVGCATQSPQVVGSCAAVGVVRGLSGFQRCLAEARLGKLPGEGFPELFGRGLAEAALVFPPIWSELELTVSPEGWASARILRHSLFPSINFYEQCVPYPSSSVANLSAPLYTAKYRHDGGVHYYDRWIRHGWGPVQSGPLATAGPLSGNPWDIVHP